MRSSSATSRRCARSRRRRWRPTIPGEAFFDFVWRIAELNMSTPGLHRCVVHCGRQARCRRAGEARRPSRSRAQRAGAVRRDVKAEDVRLLVRGALTNAPAGQWRRYLDGRARTACALRVPAVSWFVRNVREMKWWDRGPRGFVDRARRGRRRTGRREPLRPRPRPADVDVPLGGRPGGLPRPLGRGVARRRRRRAAAAAVGLLPLPAERLAHDRRCRLRAVRDPRDRGPGAPGRPRLGRLPAVRARDEARRGEPRRRRTIRTWRTRASPARQEGEFREGWLP